MPLGLSLGRVEFPLALPSGSRTLEASGGSGEEVVDVPAGTYASRWSGRGLDEAALWNHEDENSPDVYRLQLWPADGADLRERKRAAPHDAR